MKTSFLTLTLAAATLILGSAGLRAQPDPAADIVKRFDRNGDGRLDETEKVAAKETMAREGRPGQANRRPQNPQPGGMRERLAEFDRNSDGRLDETERTQMQTTMLARIEQNPAAMRRFDADGDGKLNETERAAARTEMGNRMAQPGRPQGPQNPQAGPPRPGPGPRDNVGSNPAGQPRGPVRPEVADALRARAEGNPRMLNRFDRNGDGKLDDAEWAAAQQQVGARRGPPPAAPRDAK